MNLKSHPQKKRIPFLKQSLMIVCIVICTLLVLELAFHLFSQDFNKVQQGRFLRDFQVDPMITQGIFLLDEYTFWKLAPNEGAGVNSAGFRDRNTTITDKPEGIYRIICIGDSVTFGVPVHLNPPEMTFSKQLESLIRKRFGSDKVEVLNAGNPGYTSFQGLKQLKHRLLKHEPDLLIVQFGINDSSPAVGQTDKERPTRTATGLSVYNALRKSALYCGIVKLLHGNPKDITPSNNGVQRVLPTDFKENMLMMMALGKLHDFECLFIRPVRSENGNLMTYDFYHPPKNGKVIDILTSYKNYRADPTRLFHDEVHLTPEGHELLASTIFDAMTRYKMLNTGGLKQPDPPGNTGPFRLKFGKPQ